MPKSQLVELYAHGLGVIDDARLEFGPGFNVITGETGAGKTLLLGALELCLGGDGASSRVGAVGEMKAAAIFDVGGVQEIVLTREASPTGRLRSTFNATPSSADALRALASELIVIHGQHESLALRSRSEILRIIDAAGDVSTEALDEVRRALRSADELRATLGGDAARREREMDFLQFQIDELEGARIATSDELTEALEALSRVSDLRDAQATLDEVLDELDADDELSALARFAQSIEKLPRVEAFDESREILHSALTLAREGLRALSSLADPDAFDPGAIKELDERVAVLQRVSRKYGGSLATALDSLDDFRRQLHRYRDETARLEGLDDEIARLDTDERALARDVRREREIAAARLTEAVGRQLPRVALGDASLRFSVEGDDGSQAHLLFTANPGFPEGPLGSLASGGELSRVLLALSLETAHEDVVAVFDEIDAGLGGQVAQQIGQCLAEVGRRQQVLVVTHLASVAARADHHFVIEKTVRGGVTSTLVRQVEGEQRVLEIARMLAGDETTDEARAFASQLLETRR